MADTDHPLKRLVALAPADFAAWLLNAPVRAVTTRPGELTAIPDPIDSDMVLFVTLEDGREVILHIEFQGPGSKRPMSLRMLEYLTRLALTYRDRPIHSVVIYLAGAGARDTGQHYRYDAAGQVILAWRYSVIRLWQLEAEALLHLNRPALLALLGQTRIQHPEQTVPQALAQLMQGTAGEQRERLLAEFLLLCTDAEVAAMAERLITQDYGLPETPMMRKLREEGREEGLEQGREEGLEQGREEGLEQGREQGQAEMVLRLLTRRCGPLRPAITAQVQQLDSAHLLDLAEAVLDFTSSSDLEQWLATHAPQTTDDA